MKCLGRRKAGSNLYGGPDLAIIGLIYITKIAVITIVVKKIIPIFLVRRMIVRTIAIISKVDTSPRDVAVIMKASTFALFCTDLKYKYTKLSRLDVRCKVTTAVSATKIITNTINWMDLISIIQVGQRVDSCNKWFWQIMSFIYYFLYVITWDLASTRDLAIV